MEIFQDYAYYYNSFYRDKDYMAEAQTVDGLLKKYNPGVQSLVNFGCGTGRHDLELEKLGYHCTGIDISPLMIELARKNAQASGSGIGFEVADIRSYESQKKYDAVISLFHVMSYQNTNEDILNAFRSAAKLLHNGAGACFLFDVWYGPGVLSDPPCVRVKEVEDDHNKLIRIARPVMRESENIAEIHYEVLVINKDSSKVQTIREVHSMRYFFRPELEFLLNEAGFELLDNIDCQTLAGTTFDSWTSYFIARAV